MDGPVFRINSVEINLTCVNQPTQKSETRSKKQPMTKLEDLKTKIGTRRTHIQKQVEDDIENQVEYYYNADGHRTQHVYT